MMAVIGIFLVMVGAAMADSDKMWVPAIMVGVGLVLIKLAALEQRNEEDRNE